MLDEILNRIRSLKEQKGKLNEEIIKLTDQASAEMKKALGSKTRKKANG